jgi:hypothetical protein
MSLLNVLLVLLMPFVVVGAPGVIARLSFNGRPVPRSRPARRPRLVRMAPAGGAWS